MTSPKKERTAQCLAAKDAANDVDSSDQLNEMFRTSLYPSWQVSSVGCVSTTELHGVVGTTSTIAQCGSSFHRLYFSCDKVFLFFTHVIKSKASNNRQASKAKTLKQNNARSDELPLPPAAPYRTRESDTTTREKSAEHDCSSFEGLNVSQTLSSGASPSQREPKYECEGAYK